MSEKAIPGSAPQPSADFDRLLEQYQTAVLLQLGRSQAEFRCDPSFPVPEGQELVFTASGIPAILKRLRMNGIEVRTDYEDPCTDRRALVFRGPDQVTVKILEEL